MSPREPAIDYPRELVTYERARAQWQWQDIGKIVLIRGEEVVAVFGDVTEACEEARRRCGHDRVLLRQIGAPEDFLYWGSALDAGKVLGRKGTTTLPESEPEVRYARELATYERHRANLERCCLGQFALIYGDQLVGVFADWSQASDQGCRRFGLEKYLIQEIGDPVWEITSFEVVGGCQENEPR